MTCFDVEQLDQYLSGSLNTREQASVESHVEKCDSCQSLLEEIRQQNDLLPEIKSSWSSTGEKEFVIDVAAPDIPGYEILRIIHAGGQGIVYEGRQTSTNRPVAVKLLLHGRYASKRERHRFEREIDLMAPLDHPNIVTIFDSGVTNDDRMYLVMRFVEGESLDRYMADQELSLDQSLTLFVTIAEAVRYAHQRGVIHRDLKPSNIIIDELGEPSLLDFGLAKTHDTAEDTYRSYQTQAGEFIGTLAYAAPEQVSGDPNAVDVRSDVYALGVILFEMLTGQHPYPIKGRLAEIIRNITDYEPARLSAIRKDFDDELDTIVAKSISKEKKRRYQSVADLIRDMKRYRTGYPIEAKADSTLYILRKSLKRYRFPAAAAGIMFIVLIVAAIVSFSFWRQAEQNHASALRTGEDLRKALEQTALETNKVTAINEFLIGMLGSAHPVMQGKDVTVREALDTATDTINESFTDQPLIEAELRSTIGNTYRALGLFESAELQIEKAVEIYGAFVDEIDPKRLTAESMLALLYQEQGRYEESEPLTVSTYEKRLSVLGEGHPDTLNSMNDLGLLHLKMGRYNEAESIWQRALDIRQQVFGSEDMLTLHSQSNLGWVWLLQGRYKDAESILNETLESQRRVLGDEHTITLRTLTILGVVLDRQGRYDEAEAVYLETLETKRRVLGEDHPETLIDSGNLGWFYIRRKRYKDAEQIFSADLVTTRHVLGDEHPGTLQTIENLANTYSGLERYDEAEALYLENLEIKSRILGEEHPETLHTMNNLAVLYYNLDQFDKVEPLWEETLEIRKRALGLEHPDTILTINNLALLYQQQGRYDESERNFRQVIRNQRRVLGDTHPKTVSAYRELITLFLNQERYTDAERELLAVYELYNEQLGNGHEIVQLFLRDLVDLYEQWEKPEKAANFRNLQL